MPSNHHIQPVDIEAWTERAAEELLTRGNSVIMTIPLDNAAPRANLEAATRQGVPKAAFVPPRTPMRRDSLNRREALLRGNEGSRRRQRWENDRLLNNPWAQPPLASDWEVHPTHPKHVVPYFLAPLWDANMAARREAEQKKRTALQVSPEEEAARRVAKDVRDKLKKAKAARGLLQDLEEEVRKFVTSWKQKERELAREGLHDVDSDEDEIVFVGKNGRMHDMPSPKSKNAKEEEEVKKEKLVFDSLADDHGAGFGRWLVHSIASYYGLRTWSVTVGDPARREAYVGINQMKTGTRPVSAHETLPRPLYCLV